MRILTLIRLRSDEGSSLVEFAFVALVLVATLMGVVEMGRMILVYTTMANAARAGARYAMVHGGDRTGSGTDGPSSATSYSEVQTVAQNFASAGLLNGSNVTVAVTYPKHTALVPGNFPGDTVDVTVSYTYDPLIGYFSSILNKTVSSTSEAVITY